jgi:hypothetical protein
MMLTIHLRRVVCKTAKVSGEVRRTTDHVFESTSNLRLIGAGDPLAQSVPPSYGPFLRESGSGWLFAGPVLERHPPRALLWNYLTGGWKGGYRRAAGAAQKLEFCADRIDPYHPRPLIKLLQ